VKHPTTTRVDRLRVKRTGLGFRRMEVYVHVDDTDIVREFARKLKAKRDEVRAAEQAALNETVEERLKRQAEEARQKFLKVKHEI